MKRLLIATDCFVPRWDGISRFLLEVVPSLSRHFEITIAAPDFGSCRGFESARVVRFPLVRVAFGDIEFSRPAGRLRRLVREHDLVFVQTIGPVGMSAIRAASRQKKPVVAFAHSIEWELATRSVKRFKLLANILTRRIARHYYNKCDLILVPAEEVRAKHRKNSITAKSEIVNLGTDTGYFVPSASKEESRRKIGLDPYTKIVGYCGRIGREKDLITLYRAFRRVEKTHPDTQLLIVGKGVRELEQMFSSCRNIVLPGAVDNVVDYLQAMDVFVLSSLTETSSLATMEAMACGLPVLTTPVGFVKEYIVEKHNGMFFPFRNSLVLSMKMAMLLENENLRAELGRNARKTIEDNFRWEHTIAQIEQIFARFA